MSILITIYLFFLGLIFGSFINALVWRLRQQLDDDGNPVKLSKKQSNKLSIFKGRSMCPSCKHELAAKDLIPIFSWLSLRGKCRYCKKPISKQYPATEFLTAFLFTLSYIFWPYTLAGYEWVVFGGFIGALVCLIALAIYDLKWTILPSKLIYIGSLIYGIALLAYALITGDYIRWSLALISGFIYLAIFFGIFLISVVANKKGWSKQDWLGFGDVRLAFFLGLVVGDPILVFVAMFAASIIGIVAVLPGMLQSKIKMTTQIPFGPFLIAGAIVTLWWGQSLVDWYLYNILSI